MKKVAIMTLEQNLSSIAESLKIIAAALSAKQSHPVAAPVAPAMNDKIVAAPVAAPLPVIEAPVVAAAPVVAPAPVVQAAPADFNLTTFVLDSYKALGPVKGAGIQAVLQSVGAKNINDVKPEQYATVKAGVEALLAA